jgi:predicted nucleic acid-binding protein
LLTRFISWHFAISKDACHVAALEAAQHQGTRRLVTTAWVLTEVGDALAAPANRQGFLDLLSMLQNNPQVSIVPCASDLFARGIALFSSRMDKAWTLTDCISFVVMREYGISEALTGDHHFEQAGFNILLGKP